MIKRTNKIIALIMCATTTTTLGSSIKVFAADTLEDKDGSFYNAVAYSNKYLYDGYRGTSGDEKTTYYNNGKYTELKDADASNEAIKYGNTDIQVDNDGVKELFNLQTGQFESESIEDQEPSIKNKLIKNLKNTKRYGSNVGNYLNLDKQIATNKSSFEDVWYQYSADYNGQDVKYVTTIDINAQAVEWRNITLKEGNGIASSDFGSSYQFWFSIIDNDLPNKDRDGQPKTYNGDVQAASEYIAGRIKDYCGYDAQVVQENGSWVIQVVSDQKLDGDVITGHSGDISVATEEVPTSHIKYVDDGGTTGSTGGTTGSTGSVTSTQYVTTTTQQVSSTSTTTGAAVTTGGTSETTTGAAVTTGGTTGSTGGTSEQSVSYGSGFIIDYTKEPVYYGVVNDDGKYMDISVLANIKLGYTVNDKTKSASIKKFGEKYGDESIVANLTSLDVLAQDSNYIYAKINVEFTSDSNISILYPDGINSKNYILRFSKALGEQVDGAYTPKEATAYEMNSESDFQSWLQPKVSDDWYNLDVFAKDGELYTVRFNKNSPKNTNEIQCQEIKFNTQVDIVYNINRNLITKVNDPSVQTEMARKKIETTDADQIRDLMKPYYSIDSEGNLWVLGLRKIYEFNGGGFNEKYTVSSVINNLDVYNKDNLVAWQSNDRNIYVTNINEYTNDDVNQAASTNSDANSNANSNTNSNTVSDDKVQNNNSWVKTKLGWEFFDESGKQVKDCWIKVNEKWYLINKDGIMQTGWANISGKWYYQNSDGSMATGWTMVDNKWYYLQSDGTMAIGWVNVDGSFHYLNDSGEMSIGWVCDAGNWYHLGTDGEMSTGWLKYGKHWYYLDENGKMLSDTAINGYNLGSDGALIN